MALFLKAAAGILLTVILLAQLRQKELSVLLSMAVCAMACCGALRLLEPVVELLEELEELTGLNEPFLVLLLKSAPPPPRCGSRGSLSWTLPA